jgi:DNA-binding NtrC family response regulator
MQTQANRIPKVLIVDDDEFISFAIEHYKSRYTVGIAFAYAADVGEAIEKINAECFDAAVIDVRLPGVSGVSLGALIREHDVNIPLAYLTNLDTDGVRAEAASQRAFFLSKLRYVGSTVGMQSLLRIITEMTRLNPCEAGGARVDNHGFPRRLSQTPIEIPQVLSTLLDYSKAGLCAKAAVCPQRV